MDQFMPEVRKLFTAMRTSFIESFFRKAGLIWKVEIRECALNLGVREVLTAVLTS
jgi:hypothetical protein